VKELIQRPIVALVRPLSRSPVRRAAMKGPRRQQHDRRMLHVQVRGEARQHAPLGRREREFLQHGEEQAFGIGLLSRPCSSLLSPGQDVGQKQHARDDQRSQQDARERTAVSKLIANRLERFIELRENDG
jgi:hypothetical protein